MPTAVPERPAGLSRAPSVEAGSGRPATLPRGLGRTGARIAVLTLCQAGLLVGLGLLITGPARHLWPLTVEDRLDEAFERGRTGTLTTLSFIGSRPATR